MHLAILGTGKMGAAIFQSAVECDLELTLCGRNAEVLRQMEGRYLRKLERSAKRGEITAAQLEARKATVHFTTRCADLVDADAVLETIVEQTDIKIPVLRELDDILRPDAALFSNTSSIPIATLASELKRPNRFCGLHFFYPVMVVQLVEIIAWPGVDSATKETARALCNILKRRCITVGDAPGSPLNSVLACLSVEALYLLEEGAALPDRIDRVALRTFSPGPCEVLDALGFEFVLQILTMVTEAVCGHATDWLRTDGYELTREEAAGRLGFRVPWLFGYLHSLQRFGRRVGAGLYRYEGDRTLADDPSFYLRPGNTPRPLTDDQIESRLFYAVLNATLHLLALRLGAPDELDFGLKEILMMRNGPLQLARERGLARVRSELAELESQYGPRFRPTFPLEEVMSP